MNLRVLSVLVCCVSVTVCSVSDVPVDNYYHINLGGKAVYNHRIENPSGRLIIVNTNCYFTKTSYYTRTSDPGSNDPNVCSPFRDVAYNTFYIQSANAIGDQYPPNKNHAVRIEYTHFSSYAVGHPSSCMEYQDTVQIYKYKLIFNSPSDMQYGAQPTGYSAVKLVENAAYTYAWLATYSEIWEPFHIYIIKFITNGNNDPQWVTNCGGRDKLWFGITATTTHVPKQSLSEGKWLSISCDVVFELTTRNYPYDYRNKTRRVLNIGGSFDWSNKFRSTSQMDTFLFIARGYQCTVKSSPGDNLWKDTFQIHKNNQWVFGSPEETSAIYTGGQLVDEVLDSNKYMYYKFTIKMEEATFHSPVIRKLKLTVSCGYKKSVHPYILHTVRPNVVDLCYNKTDHYPFKIQPKTEKFIIQSYGYPDTKYYSTHLHPTSMNTSVNLQILPGVNCSLTSQLGDKLAPGDTLHVSGKDYSDQIDTTVNIPQLKTGLHLVYYDVKGQGSAKGFKLLGRCTEQDIPTLIAGISWLSMYNVTGPDLFYMMTDQYNKTDYNTGQLNENTTLNIFPGFTCNVNGQPGDQLATNDVLMVDNNRYTDGQVSEVNHTLAPGAHSIQFVAKGESPLAKGFHLTVSCIELPPLPQPPKVPIIIEPVSKWKSTTKDSDWGDGTTAKGFMSTGLEKWQVGLIVAVALLLILALVVVAVVLARRKPEPVAISVSAPPVAPPPVKEDVDIGADDGLVSAGK